MAVDDVEMGGYQDVINEAREVTDQREQPRGRGGNIYFSRQKRNSHDKLRQIYLTSTPTTRTEHLQRQVRHWNDCD